MTATTISALASTRRFRSTATARRLEPSATRLHLWLDAVRAHGRTHRLRRSRASHHWLAHTHRLTARTCRDRRAAHRMTSAHVLGRSHWRCTICVCEFAVRDHTSHARSEPRTVGTHLPEHRRRRRAMVQCTAPDATWCRGQMRIRKDRGPSREARM
jgi:hypothetical protein